MLRELLGKRRVSFTDPQRRRLAARAKALGARVISDLTNPDQKGTIIPQLLC